MEKDDAYERARAKVEKLFGFYTHLAVYVIVNVYLQSSTVAVLWGIGLFFHAFGVFGSRYKERMIEKMVKKEMGKQGISGTNEPI
ncbi:MAG: 2TM domain-containing protein, partial [Pseudomonadota bacterium]|nr:2TM domain-containing protein [Pseudomonadota bacterium]